MRLSYDPALFTLTAHAVQRMQDRYVTWKTIDDTLRDAYQDGYDGNRIILRHPRCGIRVVVDPDTAEGGRAGRCALAAAHVGAVASLPAEVPNDRLQRGQGSKRIQPASVPAAAYPDGPRPPQPLQRDWHRNHSRKVGRLDGRARRPRCDGPLVHTHRADAAAVRCPN
jgi:hypothetical protein